jgi:hypothetical protein
LPTALRNGFRFLPFIAIEITNDDIFCLSAMKWLTPSMVKAYATRQ